MVTYQRHARSQPDTRTDFQFVHLELPGQTCIAAERTGIRSLVRANAAHFHWRHNRPPRPENKIQLPRPRTKPAQKTSGKVNTCLNVTLPSRRRAQRRTPSKKISLAQSSLPHLLQDSIFYHDGNEFESHAMVPWRECQLGPLATFASGLPLDFITRCITYSKNRVGPYLPQC